MEAHARQHARGNADRVGRMIARARVGGGNTELPIIETLIYGMPLRGDSDPVSNTIRPTSATRPDKAALRARLAQLDVSR